VTRTICMLCGTAVADLLCLEARGWTCLVFLCKLSWKRDGLGPTNSSGVLASVLHAGQQQVVVNVLDVHISAEH
jgi:hypothetical protein